MPEARFRVAEAVSAEDRAIAFALRYQVFVQELGYRVPGAAPDRGLTDPEDEHAFIVLGYDADVPAATLAVDWWRRVEPSPTRVANFRLEDFAGSFGRDAIFLVRKAAVTRACRKTTLFMSVVRRIADFICSHLEARFVFLETSPYFVTLSERLGYRRYAPHFAYEDSGALAVPMCLVINDHDHLARVRSPLLAQIRGHGHRHAPDVQRYFHERWMVGAADHVVESPPNDVLDPHDDVNRAIEPGRVPLFEGVDRAHVETFLAACRIVRFKPTDVLIVGNAADTHLYLLTRGYVEVTRAVAGREIAVATRGPGDLIGEMNMLLGTGRTTTVTALTDIDAILIPEQVFREAVRDSTAVAQVNLNLAKILAQRLRVADRLITERPPL